MTPFKCLIDHGAMPFLCAAVIWLCLGNAASALTVTWNGATSTGDGTFLNSSDFDNAFITFPGFSATELVSVNGNGFYHTHTTAAETMFLDLRLDNIWTEIFTDTTDGTETLAAVIANVVFPTANVDGIRLRSLTGQNATFHAMDGDQFIFNGISQVPLPPTLPLLLSALASLALFGWSRGRRSA